ncbi:MAG TPA: DHA2 family efflux MFS transporter permease subunit [Streptosporangiaceae bacterium]|nr:DHA2 family efflux MFS transporter permease subunit [Streptosporangiaceae bacterium]
MSRRAGWHGVPGGAGTLAVLAVAEFMLTLDLSIVNVALPAIRVDLGFSQGSLPWVVNGYALTFAGFLLFGGRAADLLGGRRVFLGALGAFSGASLACGLAADAAVLVAARVVQGLSAGVLAPVILSILTSAYREPGARDRALAIWAGVGIGGGAIGGLLGGVLTDALSWRWIFFVNAPVGALLLALGRVRLPRAAADRGDGRRLDVTGAILMTGALTSLAWALIRAGEVGWASGEVMGGGALAAALLAAFVVIEARARAPLVPLPVFRSRPLTIGNLLSFMSFVPVPAIWFLLTLYLQNVRGHPPAETGLLFLPLSLAVVGGAQLSFRVVARVDARALCAAGGLLAACGAGWLGGLTAATSPLWVIVPASVAMAGGGLMVAPITIAATSVPPDRGGLASGLLNTTRQFGGALGLALLGTIAAARPRQAVAAAGATALTAGYGAAFRAGAVIFAVTAIIAAVGLPSRLGAALESVVRPHPREGAAVSSERDGDSEEGATR